jgi:hypothetical protein
MMREQTYTNILLATEFTEYFVDFFEEFFHNFPLLSFEQTYKPKLTGHGLKVTVEESNAPLEYTSLMDTNKKGLSEPKKTRTLVIQNANSHGPAGDMRVNFAKKTEYKDVIWDQESKRFLKAKVMISPKVLALIKAYNKDDHYEAGEYTLYFMRLHTLFHLTTIFKEILKKSPTKGKKSVMDR